MLCRLTVDVCSEIHTKHTKEGSMFVLAVPVSELD
jgi:hypothetical protein